MEKLKIWGVKTVELKLLNKAKVEIIIAKEIPLMLGIKLVNNN